MKAKILGALCAPLLMAGLARGQSTTYTGGDAPFVEEMMNPTKSFLEIREMAEGYFKKIYTGPAAPTEPVQLEKFYRRWEHYWRDRVNYPFSRFGGDFEKAGEFAQAPFNGLWDICNTSVPVSSWELFGPDQRTDQSLGIVISVAVDPVNTNIMYAGSNTAGLWKTVNGGATWTNMTDYLEIPTLGISAIAIDPSNPSIIYIGSGTRSWGVADHGIGVLKSTNGGVTWNTTGLTPVVAAGYNVDVVRVDPSNPSRIFAAAGKNIYKSTNGGTTWSTTTVVTSSNIGFRDMEFNILNPSIIYASSLISGTSTGAEVWVTTNSGTTWTNKTPPSTGDRVALDVTLADAGAVYAMYHDGGTTQYVKKSTNHGTTWTTVGSTGFGAVWCFGLWDAEFEISDYNVNRMYAGGCQVYRSTDGGTTWGSPITQYYPTVGPVSTHADIRAMKLITTLPGLDVLLIGNDGGVALAPDASIATISSGWNNINGVGLAITQYYGFDDWQTDPDDVVGGTQDNSTIIGFNGVWARTSGGDGGVTRVDDYSPNIVYGISNSSVLKSTNYGNAWTSYGNPESPKWWLGMPIYIDPTDHTKLWFGIDHLHYRTGGSWIQTWTNPDAATTTEITAIAVAESNPQVMYLSFAHPTWVPTLQKKFYRSTDGGATFTDITGVIGACQWASITDIAVDPRDANHVFISFNGYWPNGSGSANRVWETSNGGVSWTDISSGLPPYPVKCLTYQDGTDDVIYAGGDAGVYRWNNSLNVWECFNNGLTSMSAVTNIEINNCSGLIKASTFGRGIWEAELIPTPDYNITQNTTWLSGSYHSFHNNIVVNPGATLTIKGIVSMAKGTRIIVKPNAKLVVDGGTLTNSCGDAWEGILVEGNGAQPQTISAGLALYQGWAVFTNNATVEHAHEAITTTALDSFGNIIWTSFGGIVQATNTRFLNNRRSAQFFTYLVQNNLSYFRTCTFETNQALRGGLIPYYHVSMWQVKNVRFYGCDFKYTAGAAYTPALRGGGIISIDAKYTVDRHCYSFLCGSYKRSTFENLYYGINSSNVNQLFNVYVNETKFISCYTAGALLDNIDYATVTRCKFDVGPAFQSYGLYLNNSSYYMVQNDSFMTSNNGYVGIYANNSGDPANLIYRNQFSGLQSGIIPLNDNDGATTSDGLVMRCNEFIGNDYDIAVMQYPVSVTPAVIALIQGSVSANPQTLVGNRYSATCVLENQYFLQTPWGETQSVFHGSHANAFTQPSPSPSCSDILVNVIPSSFNWNAADCPNLLGGGIIKDIKAEIVLVEKEIAKLESGYIKLVDGGDTPGVLKTIGSTMSGVALRNYLLSLSPYLSDDALIAYINRTPAPAPGHLLAVIKANSPVTPAVMDALKSAGLPAGVMTAIELYQEGVSPRGVLETEINYWKWMLRYLDQQIVYTYLTDTIIPDPEDSVILHLSKRTDLESQVKVAQAYYVKGDFGNSAKILSGLIAKGTANDYVRVLYELVALSKDPMSHFAAKKDPILLSKLEKLALDPKAGDGMAAAQAWRRLILSSVYDEPRTLPDPSSAKMAAPGMVNLDGSSSSWLEMFPNPAANQVEFNFAGEGEGNISIHTVFGQKIADIRIEAGSPVTFDCSNLSNGLYVVTLWTEGQPVQSSKLMIQR